jgi:glycine/D-amino acid oxidase-like deaminating enzyme
MVLKRLCVVVSLLAAILVGGVVSATTASATASCGDVLLAGNAWLGSAGVDVHSNAPYEGRGTDCGGVVHNLDCTTPRVGIQAPLQVSRTQRRSMAWLL